MIVNMKTIAIIDDDAHIGDMLEEVLTKEKYEVLRAYSGTEAIYLLERNKPDLILLDLMMPGLSGEEILPKTNGVPVIVISAKADIHNKVDLLLKGAVDYMTKPFNIDELLARITVQLRRKNISENSSVLKAGNITLDINSHEVTVNGKQVRLTKTEYAILKILILNKENVIAKTVILDRICEDTPDCTDSSLKQHISNLRKKLRDKSGKDYIEAVWGIGFKLSAE